MVHIFERQDSRGQHCNRHPRNSKGSLFNMYGGNEVFNTFFRVWIFLNFGEFLFSNQKIRDELEMWPHFFPPWYFERLIKTAESFTWNDNYRKYVVSNFVKKQPSRFSLFNQLVLCLSDITADFITTSLYNTAWVKSWARSFLFFLFVSLRNNYQ